MLNEFLHFAAGAVLVAHNARFDISFVDAELGRGRGMRLAAPVIDTVMLARRLLAGRVPRMNLATLAERFDTEVRPCHRALPDAQATADVLLALLGMAQERGAETIGDVIGLCAPVTRAARTRRSLAAGAPTGPGVYLFHGRDDQVLYVGKATDLRARVRSYFSGGPARRPVEDALAATERIETRPLGSEFEAALLELELIKRLRPAANRRSAHPERSCYLTLTTDEPVPRLRVTATPHPGAISAGPLSSRSSAQTAAAAVREGLGLRTCRPQRPVDDGTCLAGELGRCKAPCRGGDAVTAYDGAIALARRWLRGDTRGRPDERSRAAHAAARRTTGGSSRPRRCAISWRRSSGSTASLTRIRDGARPERCGARTRHRRPVRPGVRMPGRPGGRAPADPAGGRRAARDRVAAGIPSPGDGRAPGELERGRARRPRWSRRRWLAPAAARSPCRSNRRRCRGRPSGSARPGFGAAACVTRRARSSVPLAA